MRSNLRLEGHESDTAWKRISHIDHPDGNGWEEMATLWKGQIEWVDEKCLESDDERPSQASVDSSLGIKSINKSKAGGIESLVVGWGDSIWVIKVHPGRTGAGKE